MPAREPIRNRIRMDGMAELMLLTILFLMDFHSRPSRLAINPAMADAKISAIWFAPDNVSSPKNRTFRVRKKIRKTIGIKAWINEGFFILSLIKEVQRFNVQLFYPDLLPNRTFLILVYMLFDVLFSLP